MNGILLIDKPSGFTSFDVIAKLRGILKIKRLGHAGTLDPMATGVLPVFVGKATKACDILPCNEKAYTVSFRLGVTTDTQDITGKVISTDKSPINLDELKAVVKTFEGEISQIPPMYSAVSVGGRRLYDLARQGIVIDRKPRTINIDEIKILSFDEQTREGKLHIKCRKGTYIRTIIHDIGKALGVGGIMTTLVRDNSSGFLLSDCHTIEEVQQSALNGEIGSLVINIDKAFMVYDEITLNEIQTPMYKNGIRLDLSRMDLKDKSDVYRVYSYDLHFLGLANADNKNGELVIIKNFY